MRRTKPSGRIAAAFYRAVHLDTVAPPWPTEHAPLGGTLAREGMRQPTGAAAGRGRLVIAVAVAALPTRVAQDGPCNPMHRCHGESSGAARARCAAQPNSNDCPPAPPPPPPPPPGAGGCGGWGQRPCPPPPPFEFPEMLIAQGDCPSGTFWEPDELPDVHQLNFVASQQQFDAMCHSQMDYSQIVTGDLTFNDASYAGVELQVHGGVCVHSPTPPAGRASS